MNPIATFTIDEEKVIKVELLPEMAPNTVSSFIHLAMKGCYDGHSIQRIVPDFWIDLSYSAFNKDYAKYFIDNEAPMQNGIVPSYGMMCMGGYGDNDIAGGEVFFPLKDCDILKGRFPVLGNIIEGAEYLKEFEIVETRPIKIESMPTVVINEPLTPIVIQSVEIETFGVTYDLPITKIPTVYPEKWID